MCVSLLPQAPVQQQQPATSAGAAAATEAEAEAAAPAASSSGPCYTEADFDRVTRKEYIQIISDAQFKRFKKAVLGTPLPEQGVSDVELVKKGYAEANPWADCCIRMNLLNWVS